jgi:twitching motility protein PilT
MTIDELLKTAVSAGASDLHLKVGAYPMMRVNGTLVVASEEKRLERSDTEAMAASMFSRDHADKFRANSEVDLAYSVPGFGRFRCNVFQQRGAVGIVLRIIPTVIKSIDELGLPMVLRSIADEPRGLVLVTGTTGSGKSTTLAAMVDHINATRSTHVITIEDPIEYLHRDHLSLVSQREVELDTDSFAAALRGALRQDPDVIMVGEMRDSETINRIIAVFPPHQQRQVRIQLANVLKAAIAQRLLPRADGKGRVPAVEVMVSTPFIRDCIVDKDKTALIHSAIAGGTSQYGMQTFDQSIFGLYQQGLVSYEEALRSASNVDEFKMKVLGISTNTESARDEMLRAAQQRGKPANPDVVRYGG